MSGLRVYGTDHAGKLLTYALGWRRRTLAAIQAAPTDWQLPLMEMAAA